MNRSSPANPNNILVSGAKLYFILMLGILLILLLGGCASFDKGERVRLSPVRLAALANMPDFVQESPGVIQEAYQFAAANPEILEHIPCYCGCNSLGHKNNLACYLNQQNGVTEFDNHAAFCQVCIDITHDVMRLAGVGKTVEEIRPFIVNKYSKYGPSTDDVAMQEMPGMAGPMVPATQAEVEPESAACGESVEANACGGN